VTARNNNRKPVEEKKPIPSAGNDVNTNNISTLSGCGTSLPCKH
jgi:hypothetical protein